MKIIIDKVYEFEIENFEFGGLSRDECIECFRDGRVNSHFAERQLTKWFPTLTHKKAKAMIYICCDITSFPKMKVKFAKGSDLIKSYPNCKISKTKRKDFFK